MATLVLSTVGTVLGGPIGGAIGSMIGQSIDQSLFGSGPRQGPRLGDLSVQTSTYGTPIPRIYGRMRVAGSIVWATELKESENRSSGGKGQPESLAYSYSASFAVALSCREVGSIGRIWADGKLLRGAAGDFKVKTEFRFHPGSEDQAIDPLIGSVEGISSTPAYRGLSLAVFEDLELAEFGNRIPFLTFEIEADDNPSVGLIVSDASQGAIDCRATDLVGGYSAHGGSIAAAIRPLVDNFGIELSDDGTVISSVDASGQPLVPEDWETGCAEGDEQGAPRERSQKPANALPASLSISYYDNARDYQVGQMRAVVGGGGLHETIELPVAMEAGAAKAVAETSLARRWAERDRLTLRLSPKHIDLRTGGIVLLPDGGGAWLVEQATIEAMVVVAVLKPLSSGVVSIPAEGGRNLPSADVVAAPTTLRLLDLPDMGVGRHDVPVIHVAASNGSGVWRSVPVEIDAGAGIWPSRMAASEALIGTVVTPVGSGQEALIDRSGGFEVQLNDSEQWLESCDDEALVQGANLAAIGDELIQFGTAIPVGEGRFRLERLVRGRRGTEWAMTVHPVGSPFTMIAAASLMPVELPIEKLGSEVRVRPLGIADGDAQWQTAVISGEAMRPPSPVHCRAEVGSDGVLELSWVRRSRGGWAWIDEMDAPLGEAVEGYRIRIEGTAGTIERETSLPNAAFESAELQAVGTGPILIEIRQIGDTAVSRPAKLTMTLP